MENSGGSYPIVPDFKGKTILIVEDNEINYLLLEAILKKTRVNIVWAKNGKEAIDFCAKDCKSIHLALMDIKMPEMNGLEASLKIKEICPDLPIVAHTAYAYEYTRQQSIASGCVDLLIKPVSSQKIIETIARYILNK